MEITIKVNSFRELSRLKKILSGEKINISVGKKRKRVTRQNPTVLTKEVFKKTDNGKDLIVCKNVDDFFKKLGI